MKIYHIFDIILLLFIAFASYYSYREKLYLKFFEYLKILLLITVSAKLSSHTGIFLERSDIIDADSYSVIVLIGFIINLIVFTYAYKFAQSYLSSVEAKAFKQTGAISITIAEVLLVATFSLYMLMQLHISKKYIYPAVKKSISYPYIKSFYGDFLNDGFVYMILSLDGQINHKELIIKSFQRGFEGLK